MGRGHTLARSCDIVGGRVGVLWCVRCGSHAESSMRGLAKDCKGVATRAGSNNIRLLCEDWRPRQTRRLHAPQPVHSGLEAEGGRAEIEEEVIGGRG